MMDIPGAGATASRIVQEIGRALVGKQTTVRRVLAAVLSGGHVLFEDYPGLGKTLLARSLAQVLGLSFRRIQFTPDLLPGDITGGYIFNRTRDQFEMRKGPVFANIVLADEINRASPRTQSALLEAMQERQVTIEGETLALPEPFVVLATQNPIEYEGTFPLPEAQLDRFMIRASVGYPSVEDEKDILRRRVMRKHDEIALERQTDGDRLREMMQLVESVYVHHDLVDYMVRIVSATRRDGRISVGASPRASLALLSLARSSALLSGRDFVVPDDVKEYVPFALGHRIILEPDLWLRKTALTEVIERVTAAVPVPSVEPEVREQVD